MQKQTKIFLILALVAFLGMAASLSLFLFSGLQGCPIGHRCEMPMFMGPGMMHMSRVSMSNEYEFLVQMIPHHEEAVQAAKSLRANTERQEMRQFAEGIIQTQSAEIEQMKSWLIRWYPDKDHEIAYQPMMRNLEGLKGDAVDAAFIEDMIPHHMTAVMMSQQLLVRGLAEHEEVAALAREIRNNQRDEIHLMMRWISEWDSLGLNVTELMNMMWVGIIVMLGLILILIGLIIKANSTPEQKNSTKISAKVLLDKRYAKGEMSQEEYRIAREDFQDY